MTPEEYKQHIIRHAWLTGVLVLLLVPALFSLALLRVPDAEMPAENTEPNYPVLLRVDGIPAPELSASSALVFRLDSGERIFEKNGDGKRAVGSITKLITAVIAAETLDPLEPVRMTADAKVRSDPDEKGSVVPADEFLKTEGILKLALIESANDAARALADAVAARAAKGDGAAASFQERQNIFVRLMNEKSALLGMASSSFANPAGTDNPANFSTARDVGKLLSYITLRHPELWAITRIVSTTVYSADGAPYPLTTTNTLLKEAPGIFGTKTGTTDEAGESLAIVYQLSPSLRLGIVILGSDDRIDDLKKVISFIHTGFIAE